MRARRPQGPPPPPPGVRAAAEDTEEEESISLFDSALNNATDDSESTLLELLRKNLDQPGTLFDAEA